MDLQLHRVQFGAPIEGQIAASKHTLGREAAIIGTVVEDDQRFVQMTTSFGGGRIVDWLSGEQLPRIC
jgi:hydrogenase expression/formation protein HypE